MKVWICRHTNGGRINPRKRGYVRYNRRLFKRMCPYGSEFAPPLGHTRHVPTPSTFPHATEDKTLNLHSTVFRHTKQPASSFFPQPVLSLFLPQVSFPPPRPNAAHNSRSQFSISADFSIRLRGTAVLTRGTRQFLRGGISVAPRSRAPTPGCRAGATISRIEKRWRAPLSPPPQVSLTSNRIASMRRRDWKKRCLEGSSLCVLRIWKIFFVYS